MLGNLPHNNYNHKINNSNNYKLHYRVYIQGRIKDYRCVLMFLPPH